MNNAFDFFDEIYCINLDSEHKRWSTVQDQFEIIGIKNRVKHFSGIGDIVRSRGCSLTHLKLIEHARSKRLENIFIFEDDTAFFNWDNNLLQNALNNLPHDWNIFNIGYNLFAGYSKIGYRKIADNLIKIRKGSDVRSNNAYAVNHTAYNYIIENYGNFYNSWKDHPIKWHLDQWYAQNFDRYCLTPLMSVQNQDNKPIMFISNYNRIFGNNPA